MRTFFLKYRWYRYTVYYLALGIDFLLYRNLKEVYYAFEDLMYGFKYNLSDFKSTLAKLKKADNENF
jgi:hypothetical protein